MTVRQLLASLDAYELSEWVAYLEMESERLEKRNQKPKDSKHGLDRTGAKVLRATFAHRVKRASPA